MSTADSTSRDLRLVEETIRFVRRTFGTDDPVPLHVPRFSPHEKQRVNEALDSTFVSTVGEFVGRVEDQLTATTASPFAVATSSGTSALHAALRVLGVEPGDEVITQPLSFVATANAIAYQHAHPVFLDVDRETLGLSVAALREFLSRQVEPGPGGPVNTATGRRVAACIPMHTFGFPADIDAITAACREYAVPIVEDAAESLGSFVGSRHTGTIGDLGALSFNGNKVITAGAGGAILAADGALAERARHLTTTAKRPHPWESDHDDVGYNYRMPNLNAALLSAQLDRLPAFLDAKRTLAVAYRAFFQERDLTFIWERPGTRANFWLMTLRLRDRAQRDQFLTTSNARGVMMRPAWRLLSELPMYRDCISDGTPNARWLADRLVNIPSSAIDLDPAA